MARARGCEACEALSKKSGGSGIFLTLEDDGDEAEVAFVGYLQLGGEVEPDGREQVWIDGGSEEYDPDNREHRGLQPRAVFSWNVFVFSQNGDDVNQVKIWKQGSKFFRTWIRDKNRKGMNYRFVIERDGRAGSKKTEYRLHREETLTKGEIEDLQGLQLLSYDRSDEERDDDRGDDDGRERRRERRERRRQRQDDSEPPPARANRSENRSRDDDQHSDRASGSNGETCDTKTLDIIREKLKSSSDPKAALARFTKEFGLNKVKDLPAAKVDEAMAFVNAAESSATDDDVQEVDPFE